MDAEMLTRLIETRPLCDVAAFIGTDDIEQVKRLMSQYNLPSLHKIKYDYAKRIVLDLCRDFSVPEITRATGLSRNIIYRVLNDNHKKARSAWVKSN